MQTNTLPIQLNATAPAQRNNASGNGGSIGAQFGAMLSSEIELRQPAPAPAPTPTAPKADAPKPVAADKPAQPDDAAAPQQAAKPDDTAKATDADKTADAKDARDADADGKDGADAAQAKDAADPASAMLALMASLQQPVRDQKAGATAQAFDALSGGAGKGKRGDAAQLAALQTAMKPVASDGTAADVGTGKAFAETSSLRNPALAASGAALGTDDKSAAAGVGAGAGADLRAVSAAGAGNGAGKMQAEPHIGAAELSAELALRQARETAAIQQPVAAALAQAQPAAIDAAQAAAGAADRLSARVGTDAWENQVGQKIVYMVGSEEQTASLTLNPPDLGPMQVVLSVTNDQASVTFSANQEEVRQALEDALPRLREMMSESGIALGNATVNAGMPDGRQAQNHDQAAARNGGGFGNGNRRGDDNIATVADTATRPVTRTTMLGDRGMVDTFA
jgi:flagellar hook-length control protein FliK